MSGRDHTNNNNVFLWLEGSSLQRVTDLGTWSLAFNVLPLDLNMGAKFGDDVNIGHIPKTATYDSK